MSDRGRYGEEFESLFSNWNIEFDKLEVMLGTANTDPKGVHGEVITALRRRNQEIMARRQKVL